MSNKHVNGLKTSRTGNDVYVSFRKAKCRDKKKPGSTNRKKNSTKKFENKVDP
jgi:hypothetical protein